MVFSKIVNCLDMDGEPNFQHLMIVEQYNLLTTLSVLHMDFNSFRVLNT